MKLGTVWVASTSNRGSYDSRYMGPMKISIISAKATSVMASLIWIRLLAAGAIGLVAWRGQFWVIPLSLIAPCLTAVLLSRMAAGFTALIYYGMASLPAIAVSEAYWPSKTVLAIALWFTASPVLTLPWVAFSTRQSAVKPFAATAAVLLSAVPPLCIVGWASPLISPGSRVIGTTHSASTRPKISSRSDAARNRTTIT